MGDFKYYVKNSKYDQKDCSKKNYGQKQYDYGFNLSTMSKSQIST